MTRSTARRLLVAAPELSDPNFARTVVFMVEHSPDGALGVVLNRPTATNVDTVLPAWSPFTCAPDRVFVGGPVATDDAVIGLARAAAGADLAASSEGWQRLLGPIGTVDLGADPVALSPPVDAVRVFAGYAGWGPGQLDAELLQGGWHVVDAAPDDLLTEVPELLWRDVLRRQGGDLAMAANHPADPSVN